MMPAIDIKILKNETVPFVRDVATLYLSIQLVSRCVERYFTLISQLQRDLFKVAVSMSVLHLALPASNAMFVAVVAANIALSILQSKTSPNSTPESKAPLREAPVTKAECIKALKREYQAFNPWPLAIEAAVELAFIVKPEKGYRFAKQVLGNISDKRFITETNVWSAFEKIFYERGLSKNLLERTYTLYKQALESHNIRESLDPEAIEDRRKKCLEGDLKRKSPYQ